jgi:hypothetical protein
MTPSFHPLVPALATLLDSSLQTLQVRLRGTTLESGFDGFLRGRSAETGQRGERLIVVDFRVDVSVELGGNVGRGVRRGRRATGSGTGEEVGRHRSRGKTGLVHDIRQVFVDFYRGMGFVRFRCRYSRYG